MSLVQTIINLFVFIGHFALVMLALVAIGIVVTIAVFSFVDYLERVMGDDFYKPEVQLAMGCSIPMVVLTITFLILKGILSLGLVLLGYYNG